MNTKEKAIDFLTNKVEKYVRSAYGSEREMMTHLLSGEVTIPFNDAVNYVSELIGQFDTSDKNANTLPSKYQIGDAVTFKVGNVKIGAKVISVHFTISKVRYDLEIKTDENTTRIYNVDSCYVVDYAELS